VMNAARSSLKAISIAPEKMVSKLGSSWAMVMS
jgi:hypothetical protein